ncbi:MAG: sigma-70 family RNA polymerase sigma factor [Flavobacteriales bacterium]|nr:sigma-70 family RNA polymerase sigma factor [Flavobacteriales bacterium]
MCNYKDSNNIIIDHLKKGGLLESNAIATLIKQNEIKIIVLVRKYNGSMAEAQDVFIEGITEVVFNIKNNRFRNDSPLSTYLYKICRLIWFQKFRSKKVSHFNQEISDKDTLSIQLNLEYSNQKEVLNSVLSQIGENCKRVLTFWSEGFSMKEIQKKMEYASAQVAMNKKNKCLTTLRELIKNNTELKQTMEELRDGK